MGRKRVEENYTWQPVAERMAENGRSLGRGGAQRTAHWHFRIMNDCRPKRILFVDHTARMDGGEIALLNLVQSLDRSRIEPVVSLFSDGPLRSRLEEAGVETHIVLLSGRVLDSRKDKLGFSTLLRLADLWVTFLHVVRLVGFMNGQRIDLVHTNSLKADVIGGIAARLARKPLIWHVRDRIDRDYLPGVVVRVFRWLSGVLPSRVTANSEATLNTLRLEQLDRSEAIYSGFEPRSRMRVVHDGLKTVKSFDVARSIRRVGIVGRISPWKGQDVFLRAAAIVHERYPDVRFQIIGAPLFKEEQYERALRRLCTCLGLDDCVEFTGFCENVTEVVSYLEILVHASTTGEPFGQVVIEGMAAAKPVVATDGGGIAEIVVDSVTGLLVPMGEVGPMARAICHLLENPEIAREMGRAGRDRVMERFTIEQTAGNVERLYEELLGRGPVDEGTSSAAGIRKSHRALPWKSMGHCALSLLLIATAAALTLLLRTKLGEHAPVSAPFLAAVAGSAALCGRRAGFFATAVSSALVAYFLPPADSFRVAQPDQAALLVFICVALLLTQLIGMLKTGLKREELIRRREADAQRDLRFIANCASALSAVHRQRDLLQTIGYLATSRFCDWCVIDLLGPDGKVRRSHFSHRDAKLDQLAEALCRDGEVVDEADPAAWATLTGRMLSGGIDQIASDTWVAREARRASGGDAMFVLPLTVKDEVIGALTLVFTAAARGFSSRDARLAGEFARRAALALLWAGRNANGAPNVPILQGEEQMKQPHPPAAEHEPALPFPGEESVRENPAIRRA